MGRPPTAPVGGDPEPHLPAGGSGDEPIPWDAPSRFGPVGRLARRALRRVLRPYEVRDLARDERLRKSLAALEARFDELESTRIPGVEQRVATYVADVEHRAAELESAVHHAAGHHQEAVEAVDGRLDMRIDEVRRTTTDRLDVLESKLGLVDALTTPQPGDLGLAAGARVTVVEGSAAARRAICSLATGPHLACLAISGHTMAEYARRWDWDLLLSAEELAAGRPPAWAKVPFIRSLLDDYEWVWWLDADAIFVDPYADVLELVRPDKDLYLVEHRWGSPIQHVPNTGVMLIRSSDWSRDLFDRIWAEEALVSHPWWDNAALMRLIGYEFEPARLTQPNADTANVAFVDLAWNSIPLDPSPVPRVRHYAGTGDEKHGLRERLLLDLGAFRRSADLLTWTPIGNEHGFGIGFVRSRNEIPELLNSLGLGGCGVEVGVQEGVFSEFLLRGWRGEQLISVDPWAPDDPDVYRDIANVPLEAHEANLEVARQRLSRYADRSVLWRMTSMDAAARLPNGCLDFVYLDARHDQDSVWRDLEAWWPKVRPGGLLAGHDYVDGDLDEGRFGVKTAVDRFFAERGLLVRSTRDDTWPSWLVLRPSRSVPA